MNALKRIATGLKELRNFVETNSERFDLHEKDSPNHKEVDRLQWLSDSLSNFLQRGEQLYFVGFLGHYSSGKSSTINSLTGEKIQEVGRHPTDDGVTLITHANNGTSLEGMEKGGFSGGNLVVPILLKPCNGELFQQIVLMDTPGSGDVPGTVDAKLLDEIIREFLPLCDLLVYCFDAAHMLDNADMPLLLKKQQELPDVPMLIVVNRADDFRLDENVDWDPVHNFDQKSADQDVQRLLLRIEQALIEEEIGRPTSRDAIRKTPVLLVKNTGVKYNVDKLTEHIQNQAQRHFAGERQKLDEQKQSYFQERAGEKWLWATEWFRQRTQQANLLNDTVLRNYGDFQDNLKLVVKNVEAEWNRAIKRVEELRAKLMEPLPRLPAAKAFEVAALDDAEMERWLASAKKDVQLIATRWAEQVETGLGELFAQKVLENFSAAAAATDPTNPFTEDFALLSEKEILDLLGQVDLPTVHLWNVPDVVTAVDQLLEDLKGAMRKKLDAQNSRIEHVGGPLNGDAAQAFSLIVDEARDHLHNDTMDRHYFKQIQSYRVTVSTDQVYTVFANLPEIAEKLQEAHKPLNPKQREEHVAKVSEQFFPTELVSEFSGHRRKLTEQRQRWSALKATAQGPVDATIDTELNNLKQQLTDVPTTDASPFSDKVAVTLHRKHTDTIAGLVLEARPKIEEARKQVEQKAAKARKAWIEAKGKAKEAGEVQTEAQLAFDKTHQATEQARAEAAEARRISREAFAQIPPAQQNLDECREAQTEKEATALSESNRASYLSGKYKRTRKFMLITLGLLLVCGVLFYFLGYQQIRTTPLGELLESSMTELLVVATVLLSGGGSFPIYRSYDEWTRAEERADQATIERLQAKQATEDAESTLKDITTHANVLAVDAEKAGSRANERHQEETEAQRVLDLRRREAQDADRHAQECRGALAKLVDPEQQQPLRFSAEVLSELREFLEKPIKSYLDGDCEIADTIQTIATADLNHQLNQFAQSRFIQQARSSRNKVDQYLGSSKSLWDATCDVMKDLADLCLRILVLTGDRAPQDIFQKVQKEFLQGSLDIVREHAEEWTRLNDTLATLAQNYGNPLANSENGPESNDLELEAE